MNENAPALIPSYWASISGGKDSLLMFRLMLDNPEKYPLDGVVHFDLEIDYPFIKNVVNAVETECKKRGIRFLRIRPRVSWYDLLEKYLFPSHRVRWCNSMYKMDCKRQLVAWLKEHGKRCIFYIGYCADETARFSKRAGYAELYPLVDYDIQEDLVLKWARNESIFNDYYIYNKRCGCMFCPMASRIELAYLYKYYPEHFHFLFEQMEKTENELSKKKGKPVAIMQSNPKYNAAYIRANVINKFLPKLEKIKKQYETEVNNHE